MKHRLDDGSKEFELSLRIPAPTTFDEAFPSEESFRHAWKTIQAPGGIKHFDSTDSHGQTWRLPIDGTDSFGIPRPDHLRTEELPTCEPAEFADKVNRTFDLYGADF